MRNSEWNNVDKITWKKSKYERQNQNSVDSKQKKTYKHTHWRKQNSNNNNNTNKNTRIQNKNESGDENSNWMKSNRWIRMNWISNCCFDLVQTIVAAAIAAAVGMHAPFNIHKHTRPSQTKADTCTNRQTAKKWHFVVGWRRKGVFVWINFYRTLSLWLAKAQTKQTLFKLFYQHQMSRNAHKHIERHKKHLSAAPTYHMTAQ